MSNHDEDDNYLWDKSGRPDPDLARIEALLSTLRHTPREFVAPVASASGRETAGFRARLALAASITIIGGTALWLSRPPAAIDPETPQCNVSALEGTSHAGAVAVLPGDSPVSLALGQEVVTGANSRARIVLANGIGTVDLDPGSRVRLEELEHHAQRLSLAEGSISASVIAVPRLFIVDTPSARAVDLGCAYTLAVDAAGNGRLAVTSGRVELEEGTRRSVVPAGAACETREGFGPGTPYWNDATPAFRAALARVDFEMGGTAAIPDVLREARPADALTLVHLLPRARTADLPALYAQLAAIAPPPAGVTLDAIERRQGWAQDAWRDSVVNLDTGSWKGIDPKQMLPKKRPPSP